MTDDIKKKKKREERPSLEAAVEEYNKTRGTIKVAVLKRMAKYLLQHKGMLLFCFSIMLVSNLLALAAPKLSQSAIDAIEL